MVRRFSDGSELRFGRGRFDKWCVFYRELDGKRKALLDADYFADLRNLAEKYGVDRIFGNFEAVFREVNHVDLPEARVLDAISSCSLWYGEDALKFEKTMTVLYATMIAEENKRNGYVGKYLKRLAVYELLFCGEKTCVVARKFDGVGAGSLWETLIGYGLAPVGSRAVRRDRLPSGVRNVSEWYDSGAWRNFRLAVAV